MTALVSQKLLRLNNKDDATPSSQPPQPPLRYSLDACRAVSNRTRAEDRRLLALAVCVKMLHAWPGLDSMFEITSKIGEGTFSCVYKARPLGDYARNAWFSLCKGISRGTASATAADPRESVALKMITPTSSEERIANELRVLAALRRHRNIAGVIACYRHNDSVLIVLPYCRHVDIRHLMWTLKFNELRFYFKSLLAGLKFCHAKNIIHRDIKPSNFLYNPQLREGVIVDFGLAQRVNSYSNSNNDNNSLIPTTTKPIVTTTASPPAQDSGSGAASLSSQHTLSAGENSKQASLQQQRRRLLSSSSPLPSSNTVTASKRASNGIPPKSSGQQQQQLLLLPQQQQREQQHLLPQRLLLLKNDKRPAINASRAGTRGFRAPEVLLKVVEQTAAIDMWSVGVILLCFLTRRYPFFESNDDAQALQEIMMLVGTRRMRRYAASVQRAVECRIPTIGEHGFAWRDIVYSANREEFEHVAEEALGLLEQLLAVDPSERITAAEGVRHAWVRVESKSEGA